LFRNAYTEQKFISNENVMLIPSRRALGEHCKVTHRSSGRRPGSKAYLDFI